MVLSAFFLSGLSALIYEVVWMRMLTLVFGASVFAASTVITVYMLGLALGSFYTGRIIDRNNLKISYLKIYAFIELAIGVYCLFTPFLFSNLDSVFSYIYKLVEVDFFVFSLIRFFFCALVMIVPTILMGATLPLLAKYFIKHKDEVGKNIGFLYGLNTFGAVCGILLTAFLFVPSLGVKATIFLAVVVNIFIFAFAYYFSKKEEEVKTTKIAAGNKVSFFSHSKFFYVMLLLFSLSGFISLVYEVAWFRILTMTIGNTVYAFSVMLATFLFGLALGSYLISFFADKIKNKLFFFALVQISIGLSAMVLLPLFGNLPMVFLDILKISQVSFWNVQAVNFITSFVAIIIPTIFMGMTLPLVVKIVTEDIKEVGFKVGTLYAGNTIGSTFGSLLGGFLLIPFLGVKFTIIFMVCLNIMIGAYLVFSYVKVMQKAKISVYVFSFIVLVSSFLMPSWDKAFLISGPYLYASQYMEKVKKGDFKEAYKGITNIIYYEEGVTGTVAVVKRQDNILMSVNGKGIADIKNDRLTHTLLGSLPLFLKPESKDALLVGLGSAVTLGAMEQFPLENITAVELSKEVIKASSFFSEANYNALEDERLNLVVDDGRIYLDYSEKKYDVIVSQPSVPWMSGASNLYTVDYYEIVKKALKDDGIVCQWIQAYNMDFESLRILLKAFKEVFPHTTLWQYNKGNIFLIGSKKTLEVPYSSINKLFKDKKINKMMSSIGVRVPEMFVSGFTLSEDNLDELTKGVEINSDNNPLIEFRAPKSMFTFTSDSNYNLIAKKYSMARISKKTDINIDKQDRPFLSAMGVKENLNSDNWKFVFNGFSVKNNLINIKKRNDDVSKGVLELIEWRYLPYKGEGESKLTLRRNYEPSPQELSKLLLFNYLSFSARGKHLLNGEGKLKSKNMLLWMLNENNGVPVLSFAFHCAENKSKYIGTLKPSPRGKKEVEIIVKDISKGLGCI